MSRAARAEIVAIGTELLLGDTIDGNGAWLGRVLAASGIPVVRRAVVGDDAQDIHDAVAEALERSGCVICSGGLGPTRDDITKTVVARLFQRELTIDAGWLDELERRYAERGWVLTDSSRSQALVPRGATVLHNARGTAPGLAIEDGRGVAILLPGVPHELRGLTDQAVLPLLRERWRGALPPVMSLRLRTAGLPESVLAERIDDLVDGFAPLTLAYLPSAEGVDLRLTSWGLPEAEAQARCAAAATALRTRLGQFIYGSGDEDLAAAVGRELVVRGLTLAVAESCTGGLIAKRLTDAPGASQFLIEGFVTYANQAKQNTLGVDASVLIEHGAVSDATVRAMAAGARARAGTDCALAITGIAGPDGGTVEKPVGTVWIAAAIGDRLESRRLNVLGDRTHIRDRSAQAALTLLRDIVLGTDT